jgi:hypothetical protein
MDPWKIGRKVNGFGVVIIHRIQISSYLGEVKWRCPTRRRAGLHYFGDL